MSKMNRRAFLHKALHTSIGAGVLTNMSGIMQSAHASGLIREVTDASFRAGFDDYKALVCIDLKGGNDGFNMVIPTAAGTGAQSYADYQKARGGVYDQRNNARGVALAESDILHIGSSLGVHKSMPEVQQLFHSKKMAIVANVGPLVRPTNKSDYLAKTDLPAHLFSHSDQQILWVSPSADATTRKGWAGLIADEFRASNPNQNLPMNMSAGGENVLQVGEQEIPFFVDLQGAIKLRFAPDLNGNCERDFNHGQCAAYQAQIDAQQQAHPLRQAYAEAFARAIKRNNLLDNAIGAFPVTDSAFAPFWSTFGVTASQENFNSLPYLAKELFVIARIIRAQNALNMRRQTFYAKMGGFDTHDNLLTGQAELLGEVSKSLGAFQQVLAGLNLENNVTTFTASEFGRTTSSNGDGTDHGWGSHHLVMGGAVDGGKLYGKLPNLSPDESNPDNASWGQIIPTLSAEQYAATLCRWFGLADADRNGIFPNLRYMTGAKLAISGADLGFMKG